MTKFLVLILVFPFTVLAADQAAPILTFQAWKEQQVLEAQNEMLRVSSRMAQLRANKSATQGKEETQLPSSKVRKAEADSLAVAERDLKRAQENLQGANALTVEDYTSIYLPTLEGQTEAVHQLATKLSKDELTEIFKSLVTKGTSASDAKRSSRLIGEALTVSSRAKAP